MKKNFIFKLSEKSTVKMFKSIVDNANLYCNRNKFCVDIIQALDLIIPNDYFGCMKNRKCFNKIVRNFLTRSVNEYINKSEFFHNFNLDKIPWISTISKNRRFFLLKVKVFL